MSVARAVRPSKPNNAAFGKRAGHDPLARRTAGDLLVEHDQTECRPAKLVRHSPWFGDGGCECCADLWVVDRKPCARDAVGEGRLYRPGGRTLERAHYQLHCIRRLTVGQKNHRQVAKNFGGFGLDGQCAAKACLRRIKLLEGAQRCAQGVMELSKSGLISTARRRQSAASSWRPWLIASTPKLK